MIACRQVGFLLALFFILHGTIPLAAKTLTFDQEKCHIDIPDDWIEQKVEGNKVSFVNPDQTKSLTMRIAETGTTITLDDAAFIKGFEGSMAKNGLTITDRQHLPLAGIDSYSVDSTLPVAAGTVYNRMMVTLANGFGYGVNISKLNGKPWEDEELNGIVKSFAFIGEPQMHKSQDISDKIGFYVGTFIGVLAVIAIFKWIFRPKKKA